MAAVQRAPVFSGERQPLRDHACVRCGYGVAAQRVPDRCPMCGGSEWRNLARRAPSAETPR